MRMFRNHSLEEPQGPSTQIRSAGIKSMPRKHTITNVCLEICFETFIWQYLNQIYIQRRRQNTYVGKHPSKVRRPQTCDLGPEPDHSPPRKEQQTRWDTRSSNVCTPTVCDLKDSYIHTSDQNPTWKTKHIR